jgi:hypothetical protein
MVHELPEAQSLALDAAKVLVKAAGTDAWPAVQRLFSRLFRRWDGRRRSIAEKGLNHTAEAVSAARDAAMSDPATGPVTAEGHVRTWHCRILALLAEHPGALDELRVITGSHAGLMVASPSSISERDENVTVGPR